MLNRIKGKSLYVTCNDCGKEFKHTPNDIKTFLKEFGEYENYSVTCPDCGLIEVFNLNIPVDDTDESFATGDLPVEEEVQRYYVRLLQRLVREDFVNG